MEAIANVAAQSKWKQVFQDAMFELDPTRLQPKLVAAQKAVEDRLGEVLSGGNSGTREVMELEDALRTIRYLAKHELQT
jgi:hypothetical protein